MSEKKFSIASDGYFGISFLNIEEEDARLVMYSVNNMVERRNGLIFTDALPFYHDGRGALTVEGVATNLTNESIALNGLLDCVNAVRGINHGDRRLAS